MRWLAVLALALVACAGILGLRSTSRGPFEHRAHTVRGISCLRCHSGVETAGDEGPLHLPQSKDCVTCHQKPHDARPCLGCHGEPMAAAGVASAREHLRFRHVEHVPAAKFNCVRCHADVAEDGATLRPRMATCLTCHQDDWDKRRCDSCHIDLPEEEVLPASHVVHDGDWMREHGTRALGQADLCATCHQSERFCGSCHGATVPALPRRLDVDAASVHRAGFLARHAVESRGDAGLCSTCHREDFCLGCHEKKDVLKTSPHGPGWVSAGGENRHGREARRDPAACAACHGGAGEALCVSCHKVGGVGGSPHPAGWSSDRPLSTLPCRLCHRP